MDRIRKFGRNSKRFFKNFVKKEEEKDEILAFTTHIHEEELLIRWSLENFDRSPLNTGEYHQSPFFYSGYSNATKWALRIYPRGKVGLGKVGFYILKIPSSTKIVVDCTFAVICPDLAENPMEVLQRKNIRMESEDFGVDISPPCNDFLLQKSVCIGCVLKIGYVENVDDVEDCTAGFSPCLLSSQLKEILGTGKFSDVTLQAGKKQFPAHKAVLAARSNVFAAMFDHPMEESETSHVNIEDVEPQVLGDLLQYVYSDSVDDLTVEKATALFGAADKYCLKELQAKCVRVMMAKLCAENVCQIALLADMHSEQRLKTATNYVFRKYKHYIFDTKEWKTMTQRRPLLAGEILQNVSTEFHTKCFDPSMNDS